MTSANFIYKGSQTTILCKEKDSLEELLKKFTNKANIKDKKIIYLYNGNKITDEKKTIEQITEEKSFTILVYDADNFSINKKIITQSTEIICPECKCSAFLSIKDNKFNLTCGQNGHSFNDILIKDFLKTQVIDNDKIICNICKKNKKSNTYNNCFYRCCMCKEDICPTCKINHDKNHKIINYDERNYICSIHNEKFICYCKPCKKNICMLCENEHNKHEIINYGKIIIKNDDLIKVMKEKTKEFDDLKDKINEKINKLNIVKENVKEYCKIINEIINNYIKNQKRNYEILKNIKEIIDDNKIINFNKMEKIKIFSKYNDINKLNENDNCNDNDNNNDNIIIYNINNNNDEIRLFGHIFVFNNKNNIKLEIEDKEYELMENYKINNNKNNKLEIKIKGIENITNMEYMFYGCSSLSSLTDFSKWNTTKITNMRNMFHGCSLLPSISDISKWNTSNVTNMGNMFYRCSSLLTLPDISKWNTSNVTNMENMFYECSSLSSLPDISKWDTTNVTSMSCMFYFCQSLSGLPDISKWNTINVSNMVGMFYKCLSLSNLPDISKWNITNLKHKHLMFSGCSSSLKIPNIFKK